MVKKIRPKSARKIPKVRIARPVGRPFQLRYKCPVEQREIRVSIGSRNEEEAEQRKAELEAKLLLGIEARPGKQVVLGPEMDWSDFREHFRTLHLATVRDNTAFHAESRLDLAERILKPKTLGEIADPNALQQLQAKSSQDAPVSTHRSRTYELCSGGSELGVPSGVAAECSEAAKDQDSQTEGHEGPSHYCGGVPTASGRDREGRRPRCGGVLAVSTSGTVGVRSPAG
jgi:hypothetical protein